MPKVFLQPLLFFLVLCYFGRAEINRSFRAEGICRKDVFNRAIVIQLHKRFHRYSLLLFHKRPGFSDSIYFTIANRAWQVFYSLATDREKMYNKLKDYNIDKHTPGENYERLIIV